MRNPMSGVDQPALAMQRPNEALPGIARTYDALPYEGFAFPLTHPERLSVIATLFGMDPPAVATARVLELGCGTGDNLIPMAFSLPDAALVGYDLSPVQIERAQGTATALGLRDVHFEQRNILDVGGDAGGFDYIICHGVFSWVPDDVKEKILSICHDNLAENGVALVSYNTYPGWRMRESIREMMRYHTRRVQDPKAQVAQARALLEFLVKSVSSERNPYGMYLTSELKLLSGVDDSYIAHEHLEGINTPMYFHQFAERADRQGLQYLGESDIGSMLVSNFTTPVAQALSRSIHDLIEMEQYIDFLRNRTLRCTLLCHREQRLERNVKGARITRMFAAASVQPLGEKPAPVSSETERFKGLNGVEIATADPLTKAALRTLSAAWPSAIAFSELFEQVSCHVRAGGGTVETRDHARLATDLLRLFTANAIELHGIPFPLVTAVSGRPRTTALVRLQAERGRQVTNIRHESYRASDLERWVLQRLDGTHDRAAMVAQLAADFRAGKLSLTQTARPEDVSLDLEMQLGRFYDDLLPRFARKALLIA